jgi:hypothetical protein
VSNRVGETRIAGILHLSGAHPSGEDTMSARDDAFGRWQISMIGLLANERCADGYVKKIHPPACRDEHNKCNCTK